MNSLCANAAWLECFQEKPSWCLNEQVSQGGQKVDWILRYIKTNLYLLYTCLCFCLFRQVDTVPSEWFRPQAAQGRPA